MLQFFLFFCIFLIFFLFFSYFYVVQEPDTDGYFKERADTDPYFKSNTAASQYFSQAAALQSAYGNMSQGQFYFRKFVTIICSHTDKCHNVFFRLRKFIIRIFPFRELCHPGLTRVSSIRFLLFEIKRVLFCNSTSFNLRICLFYAFSFKMYIPTKKYFRKKTKKYV